MLVFIVYFSGFRITSSLAMSVSYVSRKVGRAHQEQTCKDKGKKEAALSFLALIEYDQLPHIPVPGFLSQPEPLLKQCLPLCDAS